MRLIEHRNAPLTFDFLVKGAEDRRHGMSLKSYGIPLRWNFKSRFSVTASIYRSVNLHTELKISGRYIPPDQFREWIMWDCKAKYGNGNVY